MSAGVLRGAVPSCAGVLPLATARGIDPQDALDAACVHMRADGSARLLPGVPADLDGRVRLALEAFALRDRVVTALQGLVEVRDVQQRTSDGRLALGSYELRFDGSPGASGNIVGQLKDLGGPLDVQGTLALTPAPGYLLNGTVAVRPDAPPGLARQIAFLGSPDGAGRRPFAQEATF
jgi:hypothetical protein